MSIVKNMYQFAYLTFLMKDCINLVIPDTEVS